MLELMVEIGGTSIEDGVDTLWMGELVLEQKVELYLSK